MKFTTLVTTILILIHSSSAFSLAGETNVVSYPVPAVYLNRVSKVFSVSVNGKSRPTLRLVEGKGAIHCAHVSTDGSVDVKVSVASETISSYRISPLDGISQTSVHGKDLSFKINGSHRLILAINNLEKLCVVVDPIETDVPDRTAPQVLDISSQGVDATGATPVTTTIQRSIDRLSATGGGILFFPPGSYRTGTINLKSKVSIYLAGGSVLIGSTNPADYRITGTQHRKGRPVESTMSLMRVSDVHDVKIFGRGVIDANASAFQSQYFITGLNVVHSSNITVDGIAQINNRGWTVFAFSNDVVVDLFKSMHDTMASTTDALDICNSKRVSIRNSLLISGDDSFAVKACTTKLPGMPNTWGYQEGAAPTPTEDVVLRDSVLFSNAAGIKIGIQAFADIKGIVLENLDIVQARAIVISHEQGSSEMAHLLFKKIRVEKLFSAKHFNNLICPFDFNIKPMKDGTAVHGIALGDVVFDQVSFEDCGHDRSRVSAGSGTWGIRGLKFRNVTISGVPVTSLNSGHIDVTGKVDELSFSDSK